ncbi:MAG TPA: tetratricopeptide repeat protein [Anaerolineales bacterium]
MADDAVFQEAVEALREGNKTRARELLTGLLKADQNNATYWVWMSSTVDTAKERIYCLQTALKLDPDNAAAKRGLILHGALPPDETIQPFPLNRPRAWEEKLLLAHEKPKLKGWQAIKASPAIRLGGFAALGALLIGAVVFAFMISGASQRSRPATNTPGPSPTYTLTPTALNATAQPVAINTSAPLSELLAVPYTATPLYVLTPHPPQSRDTFNAALLAFRRGNWDEAIRMMQQVIELEREAADAHYYIGEAYRLQNNYGNAYQEYQSALAKDSSFGPAYVGMARTRLASDPNANVLPLLDDAIRLDPNFGEAYLERARVKLRDNNIQGAVADLAQANRLLPESPLVYFYLAQARQREDEFDLALTAARRANELDVTLLPVYLLLGQLYAEAGDEEEAAEALGIYLKYQPADSAAYLLLGEMYYNNGQYDETVEAMSRAIALDRNRREAYLYRFLSNVELGNGEQANQDLNTVLRFYPDSFEVNLANIRLQLLRGRHGNALLALDRAEAFAETDEQKALAYFWGAIVHERREEFDDAAEYWHLLLDLPEDAMADEMRAEAEERLSAIATPTATPTQRLRTPTRTPTPTRTRTPTPTRTPTRSPTRTPRP